MTKQDHLEILMLLAALESWSFVDRQHLPDWLLENLHNSMDKLKHEVLGDGVAPLRDTWMQQSQCRGDKF